jgi:hypothetical protein
MNRRQAIEESLRALVRVLPAVASMAGELAGLVGQTSAPSPKKSAASFPPVRPEPEPAPFDKNDDRRKTP